MEELRKAESAQVRGKLDDLLKKIDEAGQRLVQGGTIQRLREYRQTVQSFLREAVHQMYRLREETSWAGGRHKLLIHVETVNRKLEELTRMVLEEQKDPLGVLEKVGEIRGLLIDLYS